MQQSSTIRLRVLTNKGLKFIVAIEKQKSINHLAKRLLNCYYELARENSEISIPKSKLTISSIKYNNYFLSKSEIIQNLLCEDDLITCEIGRLKTLIVDQHRSQQQSKDYQLEPQQLEIRQKLSLSKKISKKEKKKKKKILVQTSIKQKQENKKESIIQEPLNQIIQEPMIEEAHESVSLEVKVKELEFSEKSNHKEEEEQEEAEIMDVAEKNSTPKKEEESDDFDNFEIKQESSSVKESLIKSTKMEQKHGEDSEIRARIDSVDALLHKYDLGIESDSE